MGRFLVYLGQKKLESKKINIKKAISLTGADFVDINSGVEEQPGEKSLTLIDGIISSIYN